MFDSELHWAGDYSRDLLRNGIIELKTGNRDAARRYLDRALYMSSDHEVMAEAWYWMSRIADDPAPQRQALLNCLAINLQHARARRALAILDGKLKPEEIISPDALPPAPAGIKEAAAQRFMCPKCGGRMTFSSDGQALVCEYCLRNEALNTEHAAAGEKDFLIAMATARGHRKPLAEQVFHCEGCGALFVLALGQLSATCAYCGSPHVIRVEKSHELLAPDGILPHRFDQRHASDILLDWVEGLKMEPERQVERPRGLYLPLWTFDLGGRNRLHGRGAGRRKQRNRPPRAADKADQRPVCGDAQGRADTRQPQTVRRVRAPRADLRPGVCAAI